MGVEGPAPPSSLPFAAGPLQNAKKLRSIYIHEEERSEDKKNKQGPRLFRHCCFVCHPNEETSKSISTRMKTLPP